MALNARPGHHSAAPLAEINTTPLVDVMLVLFVIFLVTAPLLTHTVPLNLPKEQVSAQEPPPDRQTLSVDAGGRYFWNNEPIELTELESRFQRLATHAPESSVDLRVDEQVAYARISAIMAAAQRAGLSQLGFVLEAR